MKRGVTIIEKEEDENPIIRLTRTKPIMNERHKKSQSKTLRQVQMVSYRMGQEQYQIKVSHHLNSWEIPYRYYQNNMDPVKAFLQNNTIRTHNSRVYWNNKSQLYF